MYGWISVLSGKAKVLSVEIHEKNGDAPFHKRMGMGKIKFFR